MDARIHQDEDHYTATIRVDRSLLTSNAEVVLATRIRDELVPAIVNRYVDDHIDELSKKIDQEALVKQLGIAVAQEFARRITVKTGDGGNNQ